MEDIDTQPSKKEAVLTPKKLLERIPFAGLHNYLYASGRREKQFWALLLLISFVTTLRYLIPCIMTFTKFQTAVKVDHRGAPDMPFPAIFVGVPFSVNGTYLLHSFGGTFSQLVNDTRMAYLTEVLGRKYPEMTLGGALYQSIMYAVHSPGMEPWFSSDHVPVYNEIVYKMITAQGPNWTSLNDVYREATYRCEELLSACTLNKVPFPCCEHSQSGMMGGHSWHRINTSAVLSKALHKVPITGRFSLKFQTRIDRNQILDGVIKDLSPIIGVGGTMPSLLDPAYPVPGGTKAFLNVAGRRRELMKDCVHRFHHVGQYDEKFPDLKKYWESMKEKENYSVQKCWVAKIIEDVSYICGCVPYYDTLQPNDTAICTPAHIQACYNQAFYADVSVPANPGQTTKQSVGSNHLKKSHAGGDQKQRMPGDSENVLVQLKEAESSHAVCLPLCDAWYYDAATTMVFLNDTFEEYTTVIYNDITITVDTEYRVERDALKMDVIHFLATVGDWFSSFLGLSGVAFIQATVWSIAAVVTSLQMRRVKAARAAGLSR